jgi:alpha-galactosidase
MMLFLGANCQSFNNMALQPPMGWNSWNKFGCNVSEKLIKEMADAMVGSGMKDAGYNYIVIDDCWQIKRDSAGNIIPDPERFPAGMKALANYVHSKGLKLGIYSCAGSKTCQGRPGSRGYQFQDARQYADWDIDYLKYDWCFEEGQDAHSAYKTMSDALKSTGKNIVFSICEWGTSKPWEWGQGVGNLWRTTNDIIDCFDSKVNWGGVGVLNIIDQQVDLWKYAGPGHWNDPDMLEVGNGGMTEEEYRTHFSMWCMLAAPLMAGNDLREMPENIKSILLNKEVIQIDQDTLGKQGIKFLDMGDHEVWVKFLANKELAVTFLNRSEQPWNCDYTWKKLAIYHEEYTIRFSKTNYKIHDVWTHQDIGTTDQQLKKTVPAHGVLTVRLTPFNK